MFVEEEEGRKINDVKERKKLAKMPLAPAVVHHRGIVVFVLC